MKLKPYPEYRDSGIQWIGEIPEGWEVRKLKHVSTIRISNVDKKTKPDEKEVLLCNYNEVYNNEFITSNLSFMKATANTEQINKFSIKKEDVIITKDSESPEDIAVPSLVKENLNNIVCGYHLALIKPNRNKIKGNFLLRIFQSKKINDQFVISANGVTRFGISTYRIKNSLVIIPPLHDQTAIASFLDKKTVKIDALIEKDRKLIELLKEKRTALINHAVTKGLNPPLTPPLSGRGIVGKYEGGNLKYIPYNPALKDMARENRENPTPAEKKMWEFLQNKELEGLKFTRQKPLDKFIVDFYCAELRLAVEIDGEYHNNQKEQDKTRSEILWDKYKIRVIRYTNDQILNNPKEVLDDLLEKIKDRLASGATQLNAEFPPDKVDKRGFKDSGIEWIGKIPVGWDVRRIKHLTFNLDGKRVPVSADLREEGDVPYYGATGVLDYVNDYIFNEDLLLIGEDGAPFFDKGKNVAFLISGKSWVNNHAHVLRVNKNISRSWLCYFLNANDYTPYIKGSTRDKLNQDELSNIFVVMPKKRDQTAIANYLDKATAKIDKTIQKIEKKIALLEEYKKSLIHHVVTGKVDVRGIEA